MHPYLQSLKDLRDKRYENFNNEDKIAHIVSILSLTMGIAYVYSRNYSHYWGCAISLLCGALGYMIGAVITEGIQTRRTFSFLEENRSSIDQRAYERWRAPKPFDQLSQDFTSVEIDQLAREVIQNNLYDGIKNFLITIHLPPAVHEKIKQLRETTSLPLVTLTLF